MKGVIALCLKEMVEEKFGQERWTAVLREAGLPPETIFIASHDIPDDAVMKAIGAACRVLGMTETQVADAFGDYWVTVYAPKMYQAFYRANKTARDMILDMDRVHTAITKSVPNASPPHFAYQWSDPHTLIIRYVSKRRMIDFAVGLLKGVGHYYREDISVRKLADDRIEVKFP